MREIHGVSKPGCAMAVVGISVAILFLLVSRGMRLTASAVRIERMDRLARSDGASFQGGMNAYRAVRSTYSVSGWVRVPGGKPVGGVKILNNLGQTATTEANGLYSFTQLASGTYILTPSLAGYAFWPVNRVVTLPSDAFDQNFVILSGTMNYLSLVVRNYPNLHPHRPFDPVPANGAVGQSLDVDLIWTGGDPDGDLVTYDVYFETDDDTPDVLVSADQAATSYNPGTLITDTHYFWQIVATDEHGATTSGPVWDFVTWVAPQGWLAYLNYYRALAALPPVSENTDWSNGCWLHARYIVKNDVLEHDEDPGNPWYTPEGRAAAQSSNLMASSAVDATDEEAIDVWMQAPFHAVGILDPALRQSGFGSYRETGGNFQMGAGVDVLRGLGSVPVAVNFPVRWPGDGTTVPLTSHWGESPSPLTSCPGYSSPSGLPIILQVGSGSSTPSVTEHSFTRDGTPLEHCVFDETNYVNPDSGMQSLGRSTLDARDAIVLVPKNPLTPGATYNVSISVNAEIYAWSFNVSSVPHGVTRFDLR